MLFLLLQTTFSHQDTEFLWPIIVTCPKPKQKEDFISVSLVGEKCGKVTNNIRFYKIYSSRISSFLSRITFNPQKQGQKESFAVCVKMVSLPFDVSIKIAEWIETLAAFGVTKIVIPVLEAHPKVVKVRSWLVSVCKKNII